MWTTLIPNSMAYVNAFTRALQYFLSCAVSIQSLVDIPISLKSILILSSDLCLGVDHFQVGLAVKIFKILPPSSILAT